VIGDGIAEVRLPYLENGAVYGCGYYGTLNKKQCWKSNPQIGMAVCSLEAILLKGITFFQ